jgi:hypothetical protein
MALATPGGLCDLLAGGWGFPPWRRSDVADFRGGYNFEWFI